MAENTVVYKGGYKYQLHESYEVTVRINPPEDIKTEYISLDQMGHLVLQKGYAWDGPSGPTIDTGDFMRGSLVHDALYQLMRMEHLSDELHRKQGRNSQPQASNTQLLTPGNADRRDRLAT